LTAPGFEINGEFFAFPDTFTITDSVLVKVLGNLDMEEFGEALADGATTDPRVIVSLMGVAVARAHPRWAVEKTARFMQGVEMDSIAFHGDTEPDDEPAGTDAGPPDQPPSETPPDDGSPPLAQTSNEPPASV